MVLLYEIDISKVLVLVESKLSISKSPFTSHIKSHKVASNKVNMYIFTKSVA